MIKSSWMIVISDIIINISIIARLLNLMFTSNNLFVSKCRFGGGLLVEQGRQTGGGGMAVA